MMRHKLWIALLALLAFMATGCDEDGQEMLDHIAENISITYEVLNNPGTGIALTDAQQTLCQYGGATSKNKGADWSICHVGKMTFTLNEKILLPDNQKDFDFSIYFNNIRGIIDVLNTDEVVIEKIKGGLYRIVPTGNFQFFKERNTFELEFLTDYWSLFKTDWMPRLYITSGNLAPAVIENTDTEKIADYARKILKNHPDNWKRNPADNNILKTAATRFDQFKAVETLSKASVDGMILPTPLQINRETGMADLSKGIVIKGNISKASFKAVKRQFKKAGVRVTRKEKGGYTVVLTETKDFAGTHGAAFDRAGAYELKMSAQKAVITSSDETGLFYGLLSLRSLVPNDFKKTKKINRVTVLDAPRYEYRGIMVDVARNFHSKKAMLRLLDQMAAYKLNKLHLHLSDDEGWRLEIPGLPELTRVGARRCHDLDEEKCLLPQLGSGPDTDTNGSGYFSVKDYVQILKYANARHIEVIPELDMPAHARAAVVAMEARFKRFTQMGNTEKALQYRLKDPEDKTNYTSVQYFDDSYLNPCMDSTYAFIDKVIASLSKMHQKAGVPLRIYNFGGDETKNHYKGGGFQDINEPNPVPWRGFIDQSKEHEPFEKSPVCEALLDEAGMPLKDLSAYFAKKVSEIAASYGIEAISGWSDAYKRIQDASELATTAYVNEWDTLFWGGTGAANSFLEKNFKVLQCHPDFLYFDFPYEVDPEERGYYWGTRYIDTRKLFSFAPQNLPQNAETAFDRDGNRWQDASKGNANLNGGYTGMQAQLWSETIRTDDQLEYMAFPRLMALAERAWHKASWEMPYEEGKVYDGTTSHVDTAALQKDWVRFANLLGQKELAKLEKANIQYRIPVPGAAFINGALTIKVPFPGLLTQYQKADGSWEDYDATNKPETAIAVRIKSYDGERFGRAVPVMP